MKTEIVNINLIKSNPNNPRVIKDDKFKKLVDSILAFPEMLNLRPIVVNDDMVVLGGNMRLKACIDAGHSKVPIIKANNLSEEQQREFIIKDNIGYGEWDWELLNKDWDNQELSDWGLDVIMPLDVDLDSFFEDKEIEKLDNGKLVLQYTIDELEIVKSELLKHGKTYEDAVCKLLGI